MQLSYSRLWDNFPTDGAAKAARNEQAKLLKSRGYTVRKFTLKNQLKKYGGLDGQGQTGVCDCYFLNADMPSNEGITR